MWWRRLRLRHVKRPIRGAIHGLDLLKCRMKAGQIDCVGKKGDGPHVWAKLAPERREPAARREGLYTLFSPCKAQQCVTHMCDSRFSGGSSSTAGDVVTGSLTPRSRPQELHTRISAQSSCTRVSSLPISSTCFQKELVASDGSRIHKHSGRHTPSFTRSAGGDERIARYHCSRAQPTRAGKSVAHRKEAHLHLPSSGTSAAIVIAIAWGQI